MHPLKELSDTWSNKDEDVANATFNLNWKYNIRIFNSFKRWMNQSLIKVENKSLFA